jgi:hypothetical protein
MQPGVVAVPTTEERFWSKVEKTDDCWVWTGALRHKGYGAFVYVRDGEVVQGRAHRYSYERHVGPIPPGMFVLHRCDTPACVRPDHLFLGTNQDNVTDMMRKGRHVAGGTYRNGNYERGTAHHNARLTPELVREIRSAYDAGGTSFGQLATKYGLAIGHVYRIVRRRAWRDVD